MSAPKNARYIWFEVGLNIAFRDLQKGKRTAALNKLSSGPDKTQRTKDIKVVAAQYVAGAEQRRRYEAQAQRRELARRLTHTKNKQTLTRHTGFISAR
jgi:hypothetical protein